MDKTVDSTHVLRMYVKETADSAPELEYDSSAATNDDCRIRRPELYLPRRRPDHHQLRQALPASSMPLHFDPISTQNVLGGAPRGLGIDGFDPTGGPLTYTVIEHQSIAYGHSAAHHEQEPGAERRQVLAR